MLITGPGTFQYTLSAASSGGESASVSAPMAAVIHIFHNDAPVDIVYLGNSTHSWWNTNPLLRGAVPGDKLKIVIDGLAAMRLDWPIDPVP